MKDYLLKAYCALQVDRRGVTALEYAVVAGLIVTGLAGVFAAFWQDLQAAFNTIGAAIPG
jgi:Flp pilus assembly pilin Flp